MSTQLRQFAVVLVVLSCFWMFAALAHFAFKGTFFTLTSDHLQLALFRIFGPGLSGMGLGWLLYRHSTKAPPLKPRDVWERVSKASDDETASEHRHVTFGSGLYARGVALQDRQNRLD